MHRPLRYPIYQRIWHLVRGLLFYNTVYWRKASDGLKLPSLTAEERDRQRPERNLEMIRPRVRPRAHSNHTLGGEISNPEAGAEIFNVEVGAEISEPPSLVVADEQLVVPEDGVPRVYRTETLEDGTEQVYVKRRRYRRHVSTRGSSLSRGGFIARVFGKK